MTTSRLKDMNLVLFEFMLFSLDYAVGIWLELVYLQEVLDHQFPVDHILRSEGNRLKPGNQSTR